MPTPNSGETQSDFISRCVPMVMGENPKMDNKQAVAICYSKFRGEAMHPDFQRIFGLFIKRYGQEGIGKFDTFIYSNKLDSGKTYNPTAQFKESFEWVEPLIQPYKEDTEAKYYLVRALTANISMNNNDYGPYDRLEDAAPTLSWRPVNINHDHTRWLPYPRTRVDFATANELSVEATLRVDNQDRFLQQLLDTGKIKHPSIEGRPDPKGGYHFTGMALLAVGEEIPGDPLTEILPLVFNESVGKSICSLQNGKIVCECEKQIEVKESMSDKQNPQVECPQGQHFDVDMKKCVPDMMPEETKEMRDLRLKCSTLELQTIEKTEELTAKEEEITGFKEQITKLNAAHKVERETATNAKYTQEGVISELKNRVANAETLRDKAQEERKETEKTMLKLQDTAHEEKLEIEKKLLKEQKHSEELTQTASEQKTLIEQQKINLENMTRQHKEVYEENLKLSGDLTNANNREIALTKEKALLIEKIGKAMKFQSWAYKELKRYGVVTVEN